MTSQEKSRTGASPDRSSSNQSPEVGLEILSEPVANFVEVRGQRGERLKCAIAEYRTEFERQSYDKLFIHPEDAMKLLEDAIPLRYKVGGFEMVLRHTELLGWYLEPGL